MPLCNETSCDAKAGPSGAAAAVAGTKMTVSIKSRVRGGGSGSRLSSITRGARAGRGEAD